MICLFIQINTIFASNAEDEVKRVFGSVDEEGNPIPEGDWECKEGGAHIGGTFFYQFLKWQTRYSRNSLETSRHFLYGLWEPKVMLDLADMLTRCPISTLHIALNSVLAVDTDYGTETARGFWTNILSMFDKVKARPEVDEMMKDELATDTIRTYPLLLDLEQQHCYGVNLKIFVYDFPDLTQAPLSCAHGQWGTEVLFHKFLSQATCRTKDPEEADFFFVPSYSTCMFVTKHLENDADATRVIFNPLIEELNKYPYFSRKDGMDHIFLFADGQGPRIWGGYDLVRANSIFLQVESMCPSWELSTDRYTGRIPCSSRWKDIIIPGHTDFHAYISCESTACKLQTGIF